VTTEIYTQTDKKGPKLRIHLSQRPVNVFLLWSVILSNFIELCWLAGCKDCRC